MGYSLDDIAILFLIGFLSSAISAPFVGMLTDYYGRRSGCLLFCVLYFGSCLTKFSHHFIILGMGRVLGGISTALSQTAFESWLVSEHQNQGIFHLQGYPQNSLTLLFAKCAFANGLMSILSGIIAHVSVLNFGLISPFMESALLLGTAYYLIKANWTENYGVPVTLSVASVIDICRNCYSNSIWTVMVVQSCFESSMYIFVLLWTPVMNSLQPHSDSRLPLGILFSTFMISIMIGSQIFTGLLTRKFQLTHILIGVLLITLICFLTLGISNVFKIN